MYRSLQKDLRKFANKERAQVSMRFFKTARGEYGAGDVFIGVTVPHTRIVAKKYHDLPLSDIKELLYSKIHEERLIALIILTNQFEKASKMGDKKTKEKIYKFYLANAKQVNNWDLVDTSAHKIVGAYLYENPNDALLEKLANSKNLWVKRISIIATFMFIKYNKFDESLKIAEILLNDKHDLIHKAVGWMLREVGKRDKRTLVAFLNKHKGQMPRTTLRYAIEHFKEAERKGFLV